MEKMRIKEVKDAVLGTFLITYKNVNIAEVSTDSRTATRKSLFIPLIGENFDGHKFMKNAYDAGCINFLIDKNHEFKKEDINLVQVEDTKVALGVLAKHYKEQFDIPFVAVTGSVGKTSTKDIIYSVLKEKYKTLKNEGNLNNEIGIPKTLFKLDSSYKVAIIEMGMSFKGDIRNFCNMVHPKIGVITNIGTSHIENFNNQEEIFNAKKEITSFFDSNSVLIVNGDDPYLKTLINKEHKYHVLSYGFEKGNDIYCSNYKIYDDHIDFTCIINYIEEYFTIPTSAKHNIYNAMAAMLVARTLNIGFPDIRKGLSDFEITKGRQTVVKKKDITIIDDSYNASSTSMIAALESLSRCRGRKIAILGDILETGNYNEVVHREVGKNIKGNTDILITVGVSSKYIKEEAIKHHFNEKNTSHYDNLNELIDDLKNIIKKDDVILVKASHGMKLYELVEYLNNIYE